MRYQIIIRWRLLKWRAKIRLRELNFHIKHNQALIQAIGVSLGIPIMLFTAYNTYILYRNLATSESQLEATQNFNLHFIMYDTDDDDYVHIQTSDPKFYLNQIKVIYPKETQLGNFGDHIELIKPPNFKWELNGLRSFIMKEEKKHVTRKILADYANLIQNAIPNIAVKDGGISVEDFTKPKGAKRLSIPQGVNCSLNISGSFFKFNPKQYNQQGYPVGLVVEYTYSGKRRIAIGVYWVLYTVSVDLDVTLREGQNIREYLLKSLEVISGAASLSFIDIQLIKRLNSLSEMESELHRLVLESRAGSLACNDAIRLLITVVGAE